MLIRMIFEPFRIMKLIEEESKESNKKCDQLMKYYPDIGRYIQELCDRERVVIQLVGELDDNGFILKRVFIFDGEQTEEEVKKFFPYLYDAYWG